MSAAAFNMSPKYVDTGVSPVNHKCVTYLMGTVELNLSSPLERLNRVADRAGFR